MILSSLSDESLHTKTLEAAQCEKSATLTLLLHLQEIDQRRLYAEKGFPTLWAYVHECLGYSESQTSERVNSMRLMRKVPAIQKELSENKVTLTSLSKLATHVRRENASSAEALQLLSEISGKTSRQVDQLLAKNTTVEILLDKQKVISPKTTRLLLDVDEEFLSLLERVRELKGHPGSGTQELLKIGLRAVVQKSDVQRNRTQPLANIKQASSIPSDSPPEGLRAREAGPPSRYIPVYVKNEIRRRSQDRCEYVDPSSGKRCLSRFRLEFDHIQPFSQGGPSTPENLRHYCAAHNRLAAVHVFGKPYMKRYLKH